MSPLNGMNKDNNASLLLGNLALRFGMISEQQLQSAITLYQEKIDQGQQTLFGQVLIEINAISPSKLRFLLLSQKMKNLRSKDLQFGKLAVSNGFVTDDQVKEALDEQKRVFMAEMRSLLLGDILINKEYMTIAQRDSILAIQERAAPANEEAARPEENTATEAEKAFSIAFSDDNTEATLRLNSPVKQDEALDIIYQLLAQKKISHGIKDEAAILEYIQQANEPGAAMTIAEGEPPRPGKDAYINYYFDTDPLKTGSLRQGGQFDFKDRGEIPQVKEGEQLAELIPADPGTPGMDVFGHSLAAPEALELEIEHGKGVKLSGDRRIATADCAGSPSVNHKGTLFVFPLYLIDGDIGYETGHVNFEGDIQVKGCVQNDFSVKGGRLTTSEINAATIEIEGDVLVLGGIIGAHIKAGGNLKACYIHEATLEIGGDIIIQKEIMDSEVLAGGAILSERCTILSSSITARHGITAGDIGSDAAKPSSLTIGSDKLLQVKIEEKDKLIKEKQDEQDILTLQITRNNEQSDQLGIEIGKFAQTQDLSQVKLRELNERKSALGASGSQDEIDKINAEIHQHTENAANAEKKLAQLFDHQDQLAAKNQAIQEKTNALQAIIGDAELERDSLRQQQEQQDSHAAVTVTGTLYPHNKIIGPHASLVAKNSLSKLVIREEEVPSSGQKRKWKMATTKYIP